MGICNKLTHRESYVIIVVRRLHPVNWLQERPWTCVSLKSDENNIWMQVNDKSVDIYTHRPNYKQAYATLCTEMLIFLWKQFYFKKNVDNT